MFFANFSLKKESKPEGEDTQSSQSVSDSQPHEAEHRTSLQRTITHRDIAAGIALMAIFVGLCLSVRPASTEAANVSCPANLELALGAPQVQPAAADAQAQPGAAAGGLQEDTVDSDVVNRLKSKGAWKKFMRPGTLPTIESETGAPIELLAKARASNDHVVIVRSLEACTAWVPASEDADILELHAQLECNGELTKVATSRETSSAALDRARNIVARLRTHSGVTKAILESVQLEWARISHGAFQLSCKSVTEDLKAARPGKAAAGATPRTPQTMLASLWSLKKLQGPFKEALASLAVATTVIEARALEPSAEQLQEFRQALGATRACAVESVLHGRSMALTLPRGAPLVKKLLQCQPRMLESFEALVTSEAAQAKDSTTMFNLGLYYSDIGLSAEKGHTQVPLFGSGGQPAKGWGSESVWVADTGSTHAPSEIVQAEALMLAGEEASEASVKSDLAAARALRLYQHAKMLALKHHDSAAEWRYVAAADLAATNRRQQLAAHALSRLAYFLSLRGRKEEAVEMSAKALEHGKDDALAQFLQASLKRTLGELQTTEQIHVAEKQLSVTAGKLPSKTLEDQREAAHTEFVWWRKVATEGMHVCLHAWDAAQMLICFLSGIAYQLPGVTPSEEAAQ